MIAGMTLSLGRILSLVTGSARVQTPRGAYKPSMDRGIQDDAELLAGGQVDPEELGLAGADQRATVGRPQSQYGLTRFQEAERVTASLVCPRRARLSGCLTRWPGATICASFAPRSADASGPWPALGWPSCNSRERIRRIYLGLSALPQVSATNWCGEH